MLSLSPQRAKRWLVVGLVAGWLPLGSQATPDAAKARQGDAEAQYELAAAYFQGEPGFDKNVPLALEWLAKSAAQGNVSANYRLGEIYFHGYGGVPKDLAKAATGFQAAVDYEEAKVYLGYMYFMGQGVVKDEVRGKTLLREAMAKGRPNAAKLLWEAYAGGKLTPQNDAELAQLLEAGLAAGDVRARETLGVRLMLGQGVVQDVARARLLLPEVAERGSVLAASTLAQDIGERLTNPDRPLTPKQRDALDVQFKRMVHLVAIFGGAQGREAYVRVITRLSPLEQIAPKDRDGSIVVGDDVVEAMAWARIYRGDGGSEKLILDWLAAGEAWIRDYARISGRLDAKERVLRSEIARVTPPATKP
ncbi:MAG: sel1 repeat family protein [Opitutaceae bacterium]|nr:sel1 repeat family protein [Opitutaceae bacterium]MBP9912139.1 sel1 repeat family protein [Opitutaceae bacterium]